MDTRYPVRLLGALALACVAVPVMAQQQASALIYEYAATTPAVVATYQQATVVDGVTMSAPAVCVARGPDTVCTQTIPALPNGNHAITVSATINGVTQIAQLNVNPANGPAKPNNAKLVLVYTITF